MDVRGNMPDRNDPAARSGTAIRERARSLLRSLRRRPHRIAVRRGGPDDAPACAAILNHWIDATDWMPRVHDAADLESYFRDNVLDAHSSWVAEHRGDACGFLALDVGQRLVTALYLSPEARGRGIGRVLLDRAKAASPQGLGLWTFVANTGARAFYHREGFREAARTDGDNEEGLPDILFRWTPEAGP